MQALAQPRRNSGSGLLVAGAVLVGVLIVARMPGTTDAFTVTMPQGQTEVIVDPHALTKHELGTMPASMIRAQVERGQYTLWYSAKRTQYLALVQQSGMCGGVVLRFNQYQDGQWHSVTTFGGSEACAKTGDSCGYWMCVIESDAYVPISIGGGS